MKLPLLARRTYRFECTRCGACCRRPGIVYLRPEEPRRLARHLGLGVAELRRRYLTRGKGGRWAIEVPEGGEGCPLLDGDLCSVEPVKPGQCRSYPFWPELVGDRKAWRDEAAFCEGMNRGPKVPEEEIRRNLEIDPGPA
ncbi:MAG TPA: YkgJ family cysteine cluster protein [Vulgatibacter sp.]